MKLLVELADEQDVEILTEDTASEGKRRFITGKWAAVDEEVKNGRTYPFAVMEGALNTYHKNKISQKMALGELNHPPTPSVGLDRVSHLIESLKLEKSSKGCGVYGKARILEKTPMGAIASALIDEGVRLGVSTRGLGSIVERSGKKFVHTDFMISAIDIVSDPSGPGCFVQGINESIEYEMLEDGRIIQLAVDHAKKRIDEALALKEFSKLMRSLRG